MDEGANLCQNSQKKRALDTLERGYDRRTKKPAKPTVDSLKKIALGLGINTLQLLLFAADDIIPR